MPTMKEILERPLQKPALWLFCFGFGMSLLHIVATTLLWLYIPYFRVFFNIYFRDATTVLLFSLCLTLGCTLYLYYHLQKQIEGQNK